MSKKNPEQRFKAIAMSLLKDHMGDIFPEHSLLKVEATYAITPKLAKETNLTRQGTAYTIGDLREGKRKPMAYSGQGPLKAISVCQFDPRAPIHAQLQAPSLTRFKSGENGEPDQWIKMRLIDLPENERVARAYKSLPTSLREADDWILNKTLRRPIPNLFDVMEVNSNHAGWTGRDIMERFLAWRRELNARYGDKMLVSQDFTLLHEGGLYVMGFQIPSIDVSFVVIMHIVEEEKPEPWRLDNSMKTTASGSNFKPTPGSGAEERYNNRAAVEVDTAEEATKTAVAAATENAQ